MTFSRQFFGQYAVSPDDFGVSLDNCTVITLSVRTLLPQEYIADTPLDEKLDLSDPISSDHPYSRP